MRHALPSACTLVVLAACTPAEPPATPAPAAPATAVPAGPAGPAYDTVAPAANRTATYTCGDLDVEVVYDNTAGHAALTIGGKTLTLPLARSGSGARYADAQGNELWTKGMDEGMLTLAGEARRNCVASR